MMLIDTQASFPKANKVADAGPVAAMLGTNKLNKRVSTVADESNTLPNPPDFQASHKIKKTAPIPKQDKSMKEGKPPPGYFMPSYHHPPPHHLPAMPPPYHHPHGYASMVPPVPPYHPQHPGHPNTTGVHHPQAYSYARRTVLPEPKKLYDGKEKVGADRKNEIKVSPMKKPLSVIDGASLLLEAARVQQERQDQQDAEASTATSSSSSTVPQLVSEEQENHRHHQGYLYAPVEHPTMTAPYPQHSYHHPSYHHPPPPPGHYQHPPFQHRKLPQHQSKAEPRKKIKVCKVGNSQAKPTRRGPWTETEDALLRSAVTKMGAHRWAKIAEHLPGREGKHCRNRWYHHLSPNVNKNSWTLQEDYIILQMHQAYGNRWSVIARQLVGRTDNAVKNRFNASMRSKIEAYLMCCRGCNRVEQDDQGKYFYGDDLEGCLWAIRGPPDSDAAIRMTLGTKRLTNSYFLSVREWSEKWKKENAQQIAQYKQALQLLQAPSSFNQHLLQPISLTFNKE